MDGRPILLGVTGGIATYKAADLASRLTRAGAAVDVIMTDAATRFVQPLTFQTLTRRRVHAGLWDTREAEAGHIPLAERPELVILAPATANTLARYALGLADNLLLCTLLATKAAVLAAPAMNSNMWSHPATQKNLSILRKRGVMFVGPGEGRLACGTTGPGRMAEPEEIFTRAREYLSR